MAKKYHSQNERIKRDYLIYQKEVEGKADTTIDGIRKALTRYEEYIDFKDFATFNKDQAMAFKRHLSRMKTAQTKQPLSLSTVHATLNSLKDFFRWLSQKQGYKSKINALHIGYLNMSDKQTRIAKASTVREPPSMEQVTKAILAMPVKTEIDRRDQAVMAFILLTGMRDDAAASTLLKHIDLDKKRVIQKPDQVRTKFSKQIITFFFPVGAEIEKIIVGWVKYLREEKLYGGNDPLFPQTAMQHDADMNFVVTGLKPIVWSTAAPIRKIFKRAFEAVGLPYFNPHLLRKTLVQLGQRVCKNPEEFKAWSQNLGHEDVDTTFRSYGNVSMERQSDIILRLSSVESENMLDNTAVLDQIRSLLKN